MIENIEFNSSLDISSDEDLQLIYSNLSTKKNIINDNNLSSTISSVQLVRAHTISEMEFNNTNIIDEKTKNCNVNMTTNKNEDKVDSDIQKLSITNIQSNVSSNSQNLSTNNMLNGGIKKEPTVNSKFNEEDDYISSDDHSSINSSRLSSSISFNNITSSTDNNTTTNILKEECCKNNFNNIDKKEENNIIIKKNNSYKSLKSINNINRRGLKKSDSSISNDSGIQLAVAGTEHILCKEDPLAKIKNVKKERFMSIHKEEPLPYPKSFSWDWPYCNEGIAKGLYTAEAFTVCLPFNNGGTGVSNNATRKFEKISESNFAWQVGLSNTSMTGNCFWRMELEVIKGLNMIALIVSRDISRLDDRSKRLKRVEFKDLENTTLIGVLRFIYTGKVLERINILKFLKVADQLQFDSLKNYV
uniref:BTB domain-containing protein n=1 Tax=Parastrongyloides trichosuri TaxID=131310 RepID=A0A0N5A1H6_PARTI